MSGCNICPRSCGADRQAGWGVCGVSDTRVAKFMLHFWEEPCISGSKGSGAVFFSGCNMFCVFCQNYEITRSISGAPADAQSLAEIFLKLQSLGAHNINLVTPAPHAMIIAEALKAAKARGLAIPTVYNTNAYEKTETLRLLDGLIDIYLPDLKYVTALTAKKYSGTEDYFEFASKAVIEMHRQVGHLVVDEDGTAKKGLLVRHLVLPGSVDEARRVLDFIARELSVKTYISLMRQYTPCHRADFAPLNRKLNDREYDRIVDYCISLGFENVFLQEKESATMNFRPDFI